MKKEYIEHIIPEPNFDCPEGEQGEPGIPSVMDNIKTFLEELGLVKTSKYDKLLITYETQRIFLDSSYVAGSRFTKIKVNIKEDRNAIQISADSFGDNYVLYEGYCKSVNFLKELMHNLFGGDGQTQEDINSQFNGRLQ